MLATREAVGYFRDRHLGLCGFGIMDGAGGGLGHDVTVPGSHVIIGEPGIILYSSHDMTPTVSKDVRIVTVGHWVFGSE